MKLVDLLKVMSGELVTSEWFFVIRNNSGVQIFRNDEKARQRHLQKIYTLVVTMNWNWFRNKISYLLRNIWTQPLAQRWIPIGDIGVGILLSNHIGLILRFQKAILAWWTKQTKLTSGKFTKIHPDSKALTADKNWVSKLHMLWSVISLIRTRNKEIDG